MKKILVPLLLAGMISACAGSHVKEAPSNVAKMPVASPKQAEPESPPPAVTSSAPENKIEVNPLTDPNNILSKRSVYFDFDKYVVKPEYRTLLEAHAKYLLSHPEKSIRIEGNADDRGSREYNLALGQKRAVAVKSLANLLGVPDKQIETISYGEEKPKATGEDETSWAENRRADIVYSGE
ncbi:peptidoglycan-associated lipoprotein Pal [Methylotenera versatilis]|uniref:Peptidoglycan-associated lipoprotein n=1 Tax=Methylotenera versatilis (strain 301) TaxID=666681 RepID=D7DJF6_METV0|nr:peptidoglycan-associated lipoprotein Pal [Methylotenera versatilis]ADI30191.1 peptidoglycan-associated lipoprotein [Methylotenera versatilis 301]